VVRLSLGDKGTEEKRLGPGKFYEKKTEKEKSV